MKRLENKEVFAKNLRHYVESSGKDDKDIAAVAGVAVSTFSEWLNAKKYPRIDKIQLLADYSGCLGFESLMVYRSNP